ncbi:hypothetical protein BJY00DRAFT_283160 [Aspergillus carlsbadensis]|nr:hypothetical protein BJY00DRAFT_283160 [Aspergillus carlsbadensis]
MGGNWGDPAGAIGADDNSLLWNDFDDLIAAEAQLGSGESSGCPLTGNNSSCNSLGPEVLHGGRTSSSAGR